MSASAPASCCPRVYQPDLSSSSNLPLWTESQYVSSSSLSSSSLGSGSSPRTWRGSSLSGSSSSSLSQGYDPSQASLLAPGAATTSSHGGSHARLATFANRRGQISESHSQSQAAWGSRPWRPTSSHASGTTGRSGSDLAVSASAATTPASGDPAHTTCRGGGRPAAR